MRVRVNKRGTSQVISSTILAGAVIAMGFMVLGWTYSRSAVFNLEFANAVDTNLDRLKEKLVFEFVFYNSTGKELAIYLLNCGQSNSMNLTNAFLSNSSWYYSFPDIELMFLNGSSTESLDIDDERYVTLTVDLVADSRYSLRIVTERGRGFVTTFVA